MIRDDPATAPTTAQWRERVAAIAGQAPVPSPCVNVCRIDPVSSVCQGCRRTLDEIAGWSRMDDAAKHVVWAQLPAREPGARK